MSIRGVLALVVTLLGGLAVAATPPEPRLVDYVYVEANEGGSSGGHVAIRFGDETYHFEHGPSGLLRLRRDDSDEFRYRYGVLGNRTMHVQRIAVDDDAYARLRWQFTERLFGERALFARRAALRDDRELLALLLARRRGDAGGAVRLPGAGLFFPADADTPASPVVAELRERMERTWGRDVLARRADEARQALAALTPAAVDPATTVLPAAGYPRFTPTFSTRYRDLLTELVALDVLAHARSLRADARRSPPDADATLDEAERRHLGAAAERTAAGLVALLGSQRPDRGLALLVGIARLEALRDGEHGGRLVVVDAFPPDADVVPSPDRRHPDALRGLLAEARADLQGTRAIERAHDDLGESAVAALESAANRVCELDDATRGGDLRLAGALVPSRDAPWSMLVVPETTDAALERAVTDAADAERRYDAALARRYAYDLLTRNCVSELVATAEGAGVDLGGRVDGRWPLDVWPFASTYAVGDTWHVVERLTWPSYRQARLDDASRRNGGFLAWLRESNVVTSTIYRRNADDSIFLFFTDDAVAPRPLFGAVNLVTGLGASALGLALLPVDGGHVALAGLRGVVFSLPELAFVNLRKGSFDYVPPADRAAVAAQATSGR